MPRNVKKNIFAEPRHQVVAARGGSFKTLLQRPREKNGCSKGGVGQQQRGHCNRALNIENKGGVDGVIVFLFCLFVVVVVVVAVVVVVVVVVVPPSFSHLV